METSTQPTVSAVIVTYNRLELLKESIAAVLAQDTDALSHVIVVNNMSTDGTGEYLDDLAKTEPKLLVVHATVNGGGAGGFNLGMRAFGEQTNDKYVWLMDDDTIPQPEALGRLVAWYERHPKTGFLTSNVRWGSIEGRPAWMNVVNPRGFEWPEMAADEGAIEVVNATFVSVLISRDIVKLIGLPQKEFFIWGDDIEYTNRAADVYRGYYIPGAIVVHKSKENTYPGNIVLEKDASRMWRYRYEFRNRVLSARRVGRRAYVDTIINNFRFDLKHTLFGKHVKFRFKKAGMIISSTLKGISFNPEIEYLFDEKPEYVRSIAIIEHGRAKLDGESEKLNGKKPYEFKTREEMEAILIEKGMPTTKAEKDKM